jgi:hypothetical protein
LEEMSLLNHATFFFADSSNDSFVHKHLHVLRSYNILRKEIRDLPDIYYRIGMRDCIRIIFASCMGLAL